uniref:Enhancer of split mbeta protein n=1 Tax=Caligus rogercresseyi TaxID=217165 RepID=C1BNC9_CALRO|nr:Enhancer of split mbeta protein [Caligus rogercresseyi]|eukprot:TRINITY_DN1074_c0_g1_i5.p1 TRINITY_DN1074_c0_g1~~TRINITY_DN1074_c0_g1_i5.p1  ORF type:complete len:180 (+),score=54.73 TRINITY_DN1074_c0_g1_i5:79-618(+)
MSSINPMYSEGSPYMSKTHQYRKVMKPLIERKRRARINKCLDEIKDILIETLQSETGESITKLEKADVLEMTVKHLRNLKTKRDTPDRFFSGYTSCANHVSQYLSSTEVNLPFARDLMSHLGNQLTHPLSINTQRSAEMNIPSPPSSVSPTESAYFSSGSMTPPPEVPAIKNEALWRPF